MMRNLFKVLLVSSALVAVSAPSAYAIPQAEATAAATGGSVAAAIDNPTYAGLAAAAAACRATANPTQCLAVLLSSYASLTPAVRPQTEAQLQALIDASGSSQTVADFPDAIAAVDTTNNQAANPLPGTDGGPGSGSNSGISTGQPGSAQ